MKKLLGILGLGLLISSSLVGCGEVTEDDDNGSLLDRLFGDSEDEESAEEELLEDEELPVSEGPTHPPSYYFNNEEAAE
jgi:hypothetical protein